MAARRWLLFGLSLASLLAMTYAGVSLAYSVKVTPEMTEDDAAAKVGTRMVLRNIGDPVAEVATLADDGRGDLLATGIHVTGFVASASNVSLARVIAYVAPDANGTYDPATVTGKANESVNVTALAGGASGWIVQAEDDAAPRFVAKDDVLGVVARFENATLLPALFTAGVVGFLLPLVTIVLTHRGATTRVRATGNFCRECRAPMAPTADFCVRCGAYVRQS